MSHPSRVLVTFLSVALGVVGLFCLPRNACARTPPSDEELRTELELRRPELAARTKRAGTGLAVEVVRSHGRSWSGAFGWADRESRVPMTLDHRIPAGSVSKLVVALAVLRAAEAGLLGLEDSVEELAPELGIVNPWRDEAPVRVAHLLEHSSGFDEMRPNEVFGAVDEGPPPLRESLAKNPRSRRVRWRPGTRHAYSQVGYSVAAYLVEKTSGRPFERFVQEEILTPLGIEAGYDFHEVDARSLAKGYRLDGPETSPFPRISLNHWPSSQLILSARQCGRLAQLLLGGGRVDGRRILSEQSVRRLEQSSLPYPGLQIGYGLGINQIYLSDHLFRGHGGAYPGYAIIFLYSRELDLAYVTLVNHTESDDMAILGRSVVSLARALTRGAPIPEPAPEVELSAQRASRYVGRYAFASSSVALMEFFERFGPERVVEFEDGALFMTTEWGHRFRMVPVGEDLFRHQDFPLAHLRFAKDAQGRLVFYNGRYATYYESISAGEQAWRSFFHALAILVLVWSFVAVAAWFVLLSARQRRLALFAWVGPALAVASNLMLWSKLFSCGIEELAVPTTASISIFIYSALPLIFVALTLASSVRLLGRGGRLRVLGVHSLVLGGGQIVLLSLLCRFGFVALRSWAW